MTNTIVPQLVLTALAVAAAAAPAEGQSPVAPSPVAVRVYGGAVDPDARGAAIAWAAAIVADAGVSATWLDCTGGADRLRCRDATAERLLTVRIAPALAGGTGGPRGSVESRAHADAAGLLLGSAIVEPATGAGALATVFLDRVRDTAERTAVPASTLLGRVIAHEVGHLLLGSNGHARTGLMRDIWTDAELVLDHHRDWAFSRSERAALQRYATAGSPDDGGGVGARGR